MLGLMTVSTLAALARSILHSIETIHESKVKYPLDSHKIIIGPLDIYWLNRPYINNHYSAFKEKKTE